MNAAGLESFGPLERNTLRPLCVVLLVLLEVENGIVPSESELVLCLASLGLRESRESLECAASASLLYLKGGTYMTVESPTGGSNDILFNTNGLALSWCYAWERSYSGISLPYPWESSVRYSHAVSCRNGARA